MSFESEIQLIRAQHGGLEDMRSQLRLSRREICHILMVDPSAWSRWVGQGEDKAPPHVYRTLSMMMKAKELNWSVPGMDFVASRSSKSEAPIGRAETSIPGKSEIVVGNLDQNSPDNLMLQIESLKAQVQKKEELTSGWKVLLLITAGLVIYQFIF